MARAGAREWRVGLARLRELLWGRTGAESGWSELLPGKHKRWLGVGGWVLLLSQTATELEGNQI